MGELPSGLVTFLLSDIEGSTQLQQEFGARYVEMQKRHHELARNTVARHGGVIVKFLGDGVLAAFSNADRGVEAAIDFQSAVAALAGSPPHLAVRIGINTGYAAPSGDDYTSLALNVGARVCAAAHGGQLLITEDTAGAISGTSDRVVRDLGSYVLRGLREPVRLFQVGGESSVFPAVRATPAARHNVPLIPTSFVGRQSELRALGKLIPRESLVSVLGPGGVGKTRLAFEFARSVADRFRDGARVVMLADLRPEMSLDERVASSLGLRDEPGRTLRQSLIDWLSERDVLLVLDNCEQVMDAVADLCAELLGAVPSVHVVLTSREPARIRGENVVRLEPLPIGEQMAPGDAIRLFVERAAVADPRLRVEPDDASVRSICAAVDGLPLALELAAARLRHMSLDELVSALADRLDALQSRMRDVDVRHQTVTALLDWSWDLLTEAERDVLTACSVFQSPFRIEDAVEVCGRAGVRSTLDDLADRSLIQILHEPSRRHRMLQLVADYAERRLRELERHEDVATRHAAWVLATVTECNLAINGDDPTGAVDRYREVYDDAVAAMTFYADRAAWEPLAALASAVKEYWLLTGQLAAGREWLERVVGHSTSPDAHGAASLLASYAGDPEQGLVHARRALELAQSSGDAEVLSGALSSLGQSLLETTAGQEGATELRHSLACAPTPLTRGYACTGLGILAWHRGEMAECQQWFERALREHQGIRRLTYTARMNLASVRAAVGDLAGVGKVLDGLADEVETYFVAKLPHLCFQLADAAKESNDIGLARYWIGRGLRSARENGLDRTADARKLVDLLTEIDAMPAT